MSLLSKINLRRLLVIFLVQITFFLGLALGSGNEAQALIEDSPTTDAPGLTDEAIEVAKEKRRETQAKISEQASQKSADENAAEKLNVGESVPDSTKRFFKQIQGKEPLSGKTQPANVDDYSTPRQEQ